MADIGQANNAAKAPRPPSPEVEREDHGRKRRHPIRRPEGEAELTLSVLFPTRVIADHTYVPEDLRGQRSGHVGQI